MSEAGNWVRVASLGAVAEGTALAVEAGGRQLAVFHLAGGEICVTDNVCTHAFALLTDGWLEGHVIECPLHAGQFDVRNGKGLCPPVEEDLRSYKVRLEGDEVLVDLAARAGESQSE